ncbi:MAG: carbohydrate-binding domain-containing protein, partial [Muribaculaceae bacterium]|nr:carbohydrate-binding domain-containing protein [Muribaculaceae bacterium]
MKKILILLAIAAATITAQAKQTMWVCAGQVKYAFNTEQLDTMPINGGTSFTVLNKTFNVNEVDSIYFDNNEFNDTYVSVTYNGNTANVIIAGNIAQYMNANVNGAHVAVTQNSEVTEEIVYQLQGSTSNGSFYQDGELKITLILNGVTIHNPDSAAINIRDGKRIAIELANGTTNTLTDGTGGSQKGCFAVKGHSEFKGAGTLNITGNSKNAFWGKEYVELKKSMGTINILGAVADGFNVNQYFQQNGGTVNINGVGDDGVQVSYATDDDGNIEDDPENTATITLKGGSITITMTSDGGKGLKAEKDVEMSGGTLTITQSGNIVVEENDLSYSTSVKADGDINITGGTINITNTAQGGKGLSADGAINIDESKTTTVIDIKANGEGGIAENAGGTDPQVQTSYKIYVALPTSSSGGGPGGGGQSGGAWKVVYLYKSDGTLVQKLTNTVTRSSGYSTVTFYYYNFGAADNGEYYFKADDYRSFDGKTYTIRTNTFSGPTSGNDIYYMISNSYQSSGTTRYYSFSDVTSTYGGSGEVDEEDGTGYNAAGIKADSNLTISGGTITVANS